MLAMTASKANSRPKPTLIFLPMVRVLKDMEFDSQGSSTDQASWTLKRRGITTFLGTGLPSTFAGLNFHFFMASIAELLKPTLVVFSIATSVTLPCSSITQEIVTT